MAKGRYKVCFTIALPKGERSRNPERLAILLEALTRLNELWLADHPQTPALYESGVRYSAEPVGDEFWQDIAGVLERGEGDCEDLACWRAAELRRAGEAAKPTLTWRQIGVGGKTTLYHVMVDRAGRIEDPSRALGMRGPENE